MLCEFGGGICRHLEIAIADAEYTAKFGVPFTPCVHLEPLLQYLQNSTQHEIAAIKDLHSREIKLLMNNVKLSRH